MRQAHSGVAKEPKDEAAHAMNGRKLPFAQALPERVEGGAKGFASTLTPAAAHGPLLSALPQSARALLHRRLGRWRALSAEEIAVLDGMAVKRKEWPQAAVLLSQAASAGVARFLLSGWVCRQIILRDGRQQIFGFLVPGDIIAPDCERLPLGSMVALTAVVTTDLPVRSGNDVFQLAVDAAAEERERFLNQQVLRLGGMNALCRAAHLLLELSERLRRAGLSDGKTMPFPLKQETFGSALGITAVHVNRVLRQLRESEAIAYASRDCLRIDAEKLSQCVEMANAR